MQNSGQESERLPAPVQKHPNRKFIRPIEGGGPACLQRSIMNERTRIQKPKPKSRKRMGVAVAQKVHWSKFCAVAASPR